MEVDERTIFYSVISFVVLEFLWEFYLSIRQHKIYKKHKEIPSELIGIWSSETFNKARLYSIDKSNYGFVEETFTLIFTVAFLLFDGLHILWELGGSIIVRLGYDLSEKNEIRQSVAFLLAMNLLLTFISLPFTVYFTFVVEEKHGFNKQTVGFFIKDKIKKFIVYQAINVIVLSGIIYIVKIGGDYFFLYLWLFVLFMSLFLMTFYPNFIAPLFDKYTPLPDGELRTEIEKLAKSIGFPLYKLYVVENSKRSCHSNAYFYGFYKNKRIVLFDTLIKDYIPAKDEKEEKKEDEKKEEKEATAEKSGDQEKKGCDTYEVLAVLAHELGHWKLNHVFKNIFIAEMNFLLLFLVFGLLFQYRPLYLAFGFTDTPVLIGLLITWQYVFSPYFKLLSFLMAILSRRFEFQADRFAKSLGRSNYLKRALIKLSSDNLGFPIFDPWYSKFHHSHPPLLERLQALDKDD